nr:unnamed protein product [Callosobruchus chinensis]
MSVCKVAMKALLVLGCVGWVAAALPSYIKVCKKNDPKIAECITNSVNELRPKLVEGIPELDVPSMEPLPLDTIKLRSGPSQAKIDANITNLKVWGPSTFEVLEMKAKHSKNRFVFRINVPKIEFKGDYDMDMNVLILKYKGEGPLLGNLTNLGADVLMKGKIEKINGQNHLQFSKMLIHITIEKAYFHLGDLFSRDPNLGRAMNEVVNDNSEIFLNEIRPALEISLADRFSEIANSILKRFTYDELFPAE